MPVKIPPFDVTAQYRQIGNDLERAVTAVLSSGQYIGGPLVSQLESDFAAYIGSPYGVACNSGTDALYLALRALDIGPNDEVITVPFTFFASAEAIGMVGAKPVFVDIEAHSFNINADLVERAITSRTKAILPVHLFGRPADMTKLMAIARRYNLYVIEDCAQSTGATWEGKRTGAIGDIGCFSFYPTKNLGGCGDGGAIVTDRAVLAEKMRVLREHGSPKRYYHEAIGVNSRLDAIQAAVLLVKLPYIEKWNQQRRDISDRYTQLLQGVPNIVVPESCPGSVWNQYTIQITAGDRDDIHAKLREQGVITMIYYPLALHLQSAFKSLGYQHGSFPVTESVSDRVLSLPMFPELTVDQQEIVVESLKACL